MVSPERAQVEAVGVEVVLVVEATVTPSFTEWALLVSLRGESGHPPNH